MRADDRLGPVAKLQAVKHLRVTAGGFHDLEHGLVRDPEKWTLPQKRIVLDLMAADKIPHESGSVLKHGGGTDRQLPQFFQQKLLAGHGRRQKLQSQEHRTKRSRHDRALLCRGLENNWKGGDLRQGFVAMASYGDRANAALMLEVLRCFDHFR